MEIRAETPQNPTQYFYEAHIVWADSYGEIEVVKDITAFEILEGLYVLYRESDFEAEPIRQVYNLKNPDLHQFRVTPIEPRNIKGHV